MAKITIGLLDFGLRPGQPGSLSTVEDMLAYTRLADELGYTCMWLGEHHNYDPFAAWLNPEVLLPLMAAQTDQIRIGMAGIMLSLHSPYRVAYTFKLLNSLFPGRIDLGIAKGLAGTGVPELLRKEETNAYSFEEKFTDLLAYLHREEALYEREVVIPPYLGELPRIWSLGSSFRHLDMICDKGIHFSLSLFHRGTDPKPDKDKLSLFREQYYKKHRRLPEVSIAFSGACHRNEQLARDSIRSKEVGFIADNIVGGPAAFADRLLSLAEEYDVQQFVFMNTAAHAADRQTGIALIAEQLLQPVSS